MTGNLNIFELALLRFPVFTQVDEMYQILTEPSEKFRRDVEFLLYKFVHLRIAVATIEFFYIMFVMMHVMFEIV